MHRYYQPHKLDTGWIGIQTTIYKRPEYQALDNDCRLLYIHLLMMVDKYGNADYNVHDIMVHFMVDLEEGRISYPILKARIQKIIDQGMLETYKTPGKDQERFHITNHKIAGDLYKIPLPIGPIHPKQKMTGRSAPKQAECRADVGQCPASVPLETIAEKNRVEGEYSKKGAFQPKNQLTYPNTQDHGGQGYNLPESEPAALALAHPELNIPETIAAFLAYHRDNPTGPQYPRDQVDAVDKLRGWCKRAASKLETAKAKAPAGPEQYLDAEGMSVGLLDSCLKLAEPGKGRKDVIALIREHQPEALEMLLAKWPETEQVRP